jgi:hypothetical protein
MAGRRDFDTDEAAYLRDVAQYCDTVLLHRADESDNGEFFPDIIRHLADLGLLELMFDEQRNLHRSKDPRLSGAGAAIVLQGLFLLLHDAYYAYGSRPE